MRMIVAVTALCTFLTACASGNVGQPGTSSPVSGDASASSGGASSSTPAVEGWTYGGAQTRVLLLEDCLIQPRVSGEPSTREFVLGAGAAAVISAVLPKIINVAADAGTAYLERRKTELTASSTGRVTSELYAPADALAQPPVSRWGCLAFVRGKVGSMNPGATIPAGWTAASMAAVGLNNAPDTYLEMRIGYASHQSAFVLQPVYLEYNRTAAKRGNKKKDLLFSGTFEVLSRSDATIEMKQFGAFQLAFNDVPLGSRLEAADLVGLASQWIPLPQPLEIEVKDFGAQRDEKTNEFPTKKVWSLMPFSSAVTLQESEEAGDLLLHAIKVANDSKADVSTALLEHLKRQWRLEEAEDAEAKDGDEKKP